MNDPQPEGHMASYIGRRKFLAALGGAAAAWPLAVRAQQPERMRRIGVLMNLASDDTEGQARLAAFHQGLQQLGWTVGRNVQIDYRWGAGDARLFPRYAEELLTLAPDVILASATPNVQALQQATRSVPIVFANVSDPVGMGAVASLARPGGNTTGSTPMEFGFAAKWVELLKEIAPQVSRVAVLYVRARRTGASLQRHAAQKLLRNSGKRKESTDRSRKIFRDFSRVPALNG